MMRETGVGRRIAADVNLLAAMIGGLDVQDQPFAYALRAVGVRIIDFPDGVIGNSRPGSAVLAFDEGGESVEANRHAEVELDLPHRIAEVRECKIRIATGVTHHDEPAAPPHHFVEPEIFEM